jgi:hypothetical protein
MTLTMHDTLTTASERHADAMASSGTRERPILMSEAMVLACLDDSKTHSVFGYGTPKMLYLSQLNSSAEAVVEHPSAWPKPCRRFDMPKHITSSAHLPKVYPLPGQDPLAPEHLKRRLAASIVIMAETDCWEWQRHRSGDGYGKLTVNGKTVYAHRLA